MLYYCFSTVTNVALTRLNVTLQVHWLSYGLRSQAVRIVPSKHRSCTALRLWKYVIVGARVQRRAAMDNA